MNKYITELIGTFFLVLVIGCAVSSGSPLAPLAIGVCLTAMVYMGGHISGAHYNPAVSIAMFIRGEIEKSDLAPYILSQIVGGVLAGICTIVLRGKGIVVSPGEGVGLGQALAAEILFTFALVLVILNVATSKDHPNNSFYGIAIGFIVCAGAFSVGDISGAAFNPAVALGHNIIAADFSNVLLYLLGPIVGAVLAAFAYQTTNPN